LSKESRSKGEGMPDGILVMLVITPPMERAGTGLPGYDLPHPCPSPKMGGESIEPWHEMGGEGRVMGDPFRVEGM